MREERITRVPKEEDINKIIAHAKLKSASAYSVMRDTGLRPVELGMLRVKDIDLEGLSQEEAGQRMGVSRGTAWSLVQSARKKTTQTLTEGRPLIIVSSESYKGNPSGLM